MLVPCPPKSNVERQREFRKRNPGYFNKYNARQRAMAKRAKERVRELIQAQAQADREAARAEATLAILAKPEPLMLPAPVQDPTMAAINALAAALGYASA